MRFYICTVLNTCTTYFSPNSYCDHFLSCVDFCKFLFSAFFFLEIITHAKINLAQCTVRGKKLRREKEEKIATRKKLVINLWLNTDDGKHTVTNGNNPHTTYRRNRRKLIFLWKKSHHQSNKNRSKSVMRRVFEKFGVVDG